MGLADFINAALVRLFGSSNERIVKEMLPTVARVNALEAEMQALSDTDLRKKTDEFRDRLTHGETLDDLLPEAFAVAREASRRVVLTPDETNPQPMRHFDVQLLGGMVLHQGRIAEMTTGEGKTLVATLPAYLNALGGRGVHIITYNEFLAQRDRDWMAPLYEFLGMTAGVILNRQHPREKREAYRCDITFGQNSEFGFDYLRDNMAASVEQQVQVTQLNYAIVDEVDSILIDEARTPLIISGSSEESTEKYYQADRVVRRLKRGEDFEIKEKEESAHLTEEGVARVEKLLGIENIYADRNNDWPHHIEQSLRAQHLYKRDVKYVVKEGDVVIVDEFTGRQMPGRRWSDGLHQAIQAKEGLRILGENQTLATITYQNFFRLYDKLAGMTGTALTEAAEFNKIYELDVTVIPTNRPLRRRNLRDVIYGSEPEKYDAIEEEIVRQHATGRPLLVGTVSIEKSELLSDRLKRRGVKHEVLNAKHHEREAQIVAKAGQLGNVTIATNMAGRGTDIVLGAFTRAELIEHWKANGLAPKKLRMDQPDDALREALLRHWAEIYLEDGEVSPTATPGEIEDALNRFWDEMGMAPVRLTDRVAQLGGLHIVGTERHEARRIDNQLRGRAGRQGDPGSSRFFLSLADDLMRIFAPDSVSSILRRIGMREGMALESRIVTRSIERAQRKVEEHNFEMRKHLLEYDEVADEQRKAIYSRRQEALEKEDISDVILEMIEDSLADEIDRAILVDADPVDRNYRPLQERTRRYGADISEEQWREADEQALRDLFAGPAAEQIDRDAARAAEQCLADTLALFCPADTPFMAWRYERLDTWTQTNARDHMLGPHRDALSGDIIHARVRKAVHARALRAAREAYADSDFDTLADRLLRDAEDRFFPSSLPPTEWDLDGLSRWASLLSLSLPIRKWQVGEAPMEDPNFERELRDDVAQSIIQRMRSQLMKKEPAEVVAALVESRIEELLAPETEEEAGSYDPLARWMSRALDIPLGPSDLSSAAGAELDAIAAEFGKRVAESGQDAERCFRGLLDALLIVDLSQPERDVDRVADTVRRKYGVQVTALELSKLTLDAMQETLFERIQTAYRAREERIGAAKMRMIEKIILLEKTDAKWKDHLLAMDHLKSGIGLRGYAQLDPKVEYTREARRMFDEMLASLREDVTDLILKIDIGAPDEGPQSVYSDAQENQPRDVSAFDQQARAQQEQAVAATQQEEKPEPIRGGKSFDRNAPCPCGSGKKFKKCCGRS